MNTNSSITGRSMPFMESPTWVNPRNKRNHGRFYGGNIGSVERENIREWQVGSEGVKVSSFFMFYTEKG